MTISRFAVLALALVFLAGCAAAPTTTQGDQPLDFACGEGAKFVSQEMDLIDVSIPLPTPESGLDYFFTFVGDGKLTSEDLREAPELSSAFSKTYVYEEDGIPLIALDMTKRKGSWRVNGVRGCHDTFNRFFPTRAGFPGQATAATITRLPTTSVVGGCPATGVTRCEHP